MDTARNAVAEHLSAVATTTGGGGASEGSNSGTVVAAPGKKRKQEGEEATKIQVGKIEEAGTTTIEGIPDEILLIVLSQLAGKTLMISVAQVCKRWRKLCPEINNVHLDFLGGW